MNAKNISRIALGTMLVTAGIAHLTFGRKDFQAQVPDWVPLEKDDTVVYSGVVEIALGASIIATPKKYRSIFYSSSSRKHFTIQKQTRCFWFRYRRKEKSKIVYAASSYRLGFEIYGRIIFSGNIIFLFIKFKLNL